MGVRFDGPGGRAKAYRANHSCHPYATRWTLYLPGRPRRRNAGYVYLPTSTGASWTVNGSRPEAALFAGGHDDASIITHFLSPNTNPNQVAPKPLSFGNATWQSSLDSSKVWAQPLKAIPAGSDPSCPNSGATLSCSRQSGRKQGLPAEKS
jgi:hypothetical protein